MYHKTRPAAPIISGAKTCAEFQGYDWPPQTRPMIKRLAWDTLNKSAILKKMTYVMEGMKMAFPVLRITFLSRISQQSRRNDKVLVNVPIHSTKFLTYRTCRDFKIHETCNDCDYSPSERQIHIE